LRISMVLMIIKKIMLWDWIMIWKILNIVK